MRGPNRISLRSQIGRDETLLSILTAADVQEVVCGRIERVADPDRLDVELVTAARRSPCEDGDVPRSA